MPFIHIQNEVKQGTLCWADRWNIDLTVLCFNRAPLNEASPFFVSIKWSPARTDGELLLSFNSSREGGRANHQTDIG